MEFRQAIQKFKPVVTKEVVDMIESGQNLILFVGRESCPYSRFFAPKLAQVQEDLQLSVLFLDSENRADWQDLQAFRAEYQIVTVPGLVVSEGAGVRVVCDSSLSPKQVLSFINAEI